MGGARARALHRDRASHTPKARQPVCRYGAAFAGLARHTPHRPKTAAASGWPGVRQRRASGKARGSSLASESALSKELHVILRPFIAAIAVAGSAVAVAVAAPNTVNHMNNA